ncbi:S8 family serine peptidase [Kribbella sp. NPDC050820]|uniref:S8 family serine peptidase n=1 Tax=Kribbella sp. NPDC050820 TaxID=3155408 RepID=UPI0033E16DE9
MRSPIHRRTTRRTTLAGLSAGLLLAATLPALSASAADPSPTAPNGRPWTATPLTVASTVNGAKSPSGQLAKSDPNLVNSTSTKQVRVVVKLDYDSLASYRGGLKGLPGTSPSVTGKRLDTKSANSAKYLKHVTAMENDFLAAMSTRVPSAKAGQKLRTVYGGVAVSLPANKARDLLKLPGVAAVQPDNPQQLLTDSSASFIGAPAIYSQLGGSANSGKGIVVGILDSGAWPEHPSFTDPGTLPAPPPKADGTPRTCDFGDNPLTPAADPFVCNRKLIGGQPFLDTYNAVIGGDVYPDSARDSNGHGTHTATTSAGGPVANANPLGIDRGPIAGIAPAAAVSVYKVCGAEGCFPSDSVQAVAQAILDGVRVINFSISGGSNPYSDPVELAFLDAYAAGVFVSASAGNSGPGANTTDHRSPWVTTVAASTQSRTFRSTVTLNDPGGALETATISGATITAGLSTAAPVVLGSAPPYNNALCNTPAPAGLFAGKIVACQFSPGRVMKGFNVRQGGAVGMLMYNAAPADVFTDNHWLPTVHLEKPDSDTLLAFLAAHPGTTASFTQGATATWQGDVMTHFSSRGPGGDFLKPDVTAPGLHIMAGATPTPESPAEGPPGNLYQVIAGTSMSSPHVAGSAALVLALNPSWTPGQIKSALETTAKTSVTKPDRVTPADPFDYGGGRIDLTKAGNPGLTLDETAANYAASATDPLNRIDLNLPSVNAPTMPGVITAERVVKNVTNQTLTFTASGTTVNGASISVLPPAFQVKPGKTQKLTIAITAPALPDGQYFGQVNLKQVGGSRALHLPVAFFRQEGIVPVDQTCTPSTIARNTGQSTCTVTVQNNSLQTTDVTAVSTLSSQLRLNSVTGATKIGTQVATKTATLAGRQPDAPGIAPGSLAGYIPLDAFGVTPTPIGDEQALNFNVPPFVYAGQTYSQIGVTSNGYSVVGGASGDDVQFLPQTLPDPARPNNVLASYWTDLDGTGAPGVFATILTDGVSDWVVLEWRVNLFGTTSLKVFQQWIGVNGTEDITYAYDPANLPGSPPAGYGLTVGAENFEGTAGGQITGPPVTDYRVTSTPGAPGGSMTYSMNIKGVQRGTGTVTTGTSTPLVKGITIEVDRIIVN